MAVAVPLLMGDAIYDFILAAGDDSTDEDLFLAIPDGSYSVKVGIRGTCARFGVRTRSEVIHIDEKLASISEKSFAT
jgi:trehalose 6-phosphate synthase/phosphatase